MNLCKVCTIQLFIGRELTRSLATATAPKSVLSDIEKVAVQWSLLCRFWTLATKSLRTLH